MIRIENVSKAFGSQQVLRNVSLEIADGMTTAIVGPSGVGKSVLLKLILGMLQPDCGRIEVFGETISDMKSERQKNQIRQRLGVLFQNAALFDSLSVFDNIAFPLRERLKLSTIEIRRKVIEIAEALSLEECLLRLPQEISIGTRKRVGLARALVTQPDVVLFDEPNTGLDPLVGQEVYDLIKVSRGRWGFTGIVISHELPEVFQITDRVAMLLNGRVIIEGTPQDLVLSQEPAVQQFLNGRKDGPIAIQ